MRLSKPFRFLKAAAFSIALLAFNSCADMTSVPAPTMTVTASKTLTAPTFPEKAAQAGESLSYGDRYYTVSQGGRRKISLSWNPVGIAKYYEIFAAQNINDTFLKVGETTKPEFDDSVGSGKTYYYKVRAVNTKNEYSEFSSIVKGTSLATPAISDIEINDSNATVFWYMGNVGVDTYAKNLVYEVHAKGDVEKIKTFKAWDETTGSLVEECTFENLSGNCEYRFQVFAYITSEQDNVEKSPEVTEKTLALYTPAAPEFTASQGESINYVKLIITLPSKIQVSVEKQGSAGKSDEDYPLCFEIQRKRSGESAWQTVVPVLYYNGSTTAPNAKAPAAYDDYKEGDMIEYQDMIGNTSLSVIRGAKYDYRIISCVDVNYSGKIDSSFNDSIKSKADRANTAQGWAAARPTFKVKNYKRNLDSTETNVDSVSLDFEASWNDLGKANEYKYAVEYERDNGGVVEYDWITDTNGNSIIDSLEKISLITKIYDVKNDLENVKGTYRYTLYVFPAKYNDPSKIKDEPLDKVTAANIIGVERTATDPYRDLKAFGGWTDHILLTWTVEDGVVYNIDWVKLDDAGTPSSESGTITSDMLPKDAQGKYTGRYEHFVPGGFKYRYTIRANASSGNTNASDIPEAETLGTPVIDFTANSYTDVTVSWKQVVAAEKYEVTLGKTGTLGGGLSFTINKDGSKENVPQGLTVDVNYDAGISDIFTLTISKAPGYDDATFAGKAVPLVITAMSEVDEQNHIKGQSPASKDVWTIGPATLNLKATESFAVEATSIKITWKKLQGAKGYAVYRFRPEMTGNIKSDGTVEHNEPSLDVYFVNEAGTSVSKHGATVASDAEGNITLTDNYKKAGSTDGYEMNQQYLALGIPFTYTVLPVLAQSDATAVDKLDDLALVGKKYESVSAVQKIGYTTGYGIALEATKAEYPDKVVLTWELPQSAKDKGKTPTLWFRKKGSNGTWVNSGMPIANSKINSVTFTPTDSAATPEDDDSIQALEYAITYSGSMNSSDADSKDAAYVSYLSDKYDKRITDAEIRSVGYMFNLPDITYAKITNNNEDYSETFQWHLYNWNNDRVVGGDVNGYSLTTKNLNCSADDWPIFEFDKNGSVTANKTNAYSWYDITPNSPTPSDNAVTVKLTPGHIDQSADTGTHDGLLKVQRDYKHYYTLSTSRTFTNKDGDEMTINASSKATLYRKITNDEFAKCVTLIVADAFHKKGGSSGLLQTLHKGDFTMTTEYISMSTPVIYDLRYEFKSFQNIFAKILGQDTEFTSTFTLSSNKSEKGYAYDRTDYELGSCTITVMHETGLNSYEGTVTLKAGTNTSHMVFIAPVYGTDWDLSLTYKHNSLENSMTKTVSNNETDFKQWFPFALATKLDENETDGTNSSYPTMNGTWWEVRQK
ncbi:MAG: hypothetical protein K6A42_03155 [Treponema sp.]|nr:hypothetical protein [Treponema sp.]